MKRRRFMFVFALALAAALGAGLLALTQAEEAGPPEIPPDAKAFVKRIREQVVYGNYWQPLGFEYMLLDMEGCFRLVARKWKEKFGTDSPYAASPYVFSASPEVALRGWKALWMAREIDILREKGFEFAGQAGEFLAFKNRTEEEAEKGWPALSALMATKRLDKDALISLSKGKSKRYENPEKAPFEVHGSFSWPPNPFVEPSDLAFYDYRKDFFPADTKIGYGMLVPPTAHSLRIYSSCPIWVKSLYFPAAFGLIVSENAKWKPMEIVWREDACNVIEIVFSNRQLDNYDRFWEFLPLQGILQNGAPPEKGGVWTAWEFLDEDGRPLPDDCGAVPVKFFPKGFKRKFKPRPLADFQKAKD